jgi:hypothetical protein
VVSNRSTGSGPAVAWLFHRLLAALFLVAWLSLGAQILELIGSRGLLPLQEFIETARGNISLGQFPTLFLLSAADRVLTTGIWVGIALAVSAFLGLRPRLCFALSTVLYLSYTVAARTFLTFQWDNLLIESGMLAAFLPADRPARWAHVLFRLLLFKLYWESGIAKWQSHLGDWQDGSAMTFYYETAPLPTWLAWYAHALPEWWHHFESRAVLVLELIVPFAFFAPRRFRLAAFWMLTGFQLLNLATANYGLFCYLSLALHVFLLDDRDVAWLRPWRQRARDALPRGMSWWRRGARSTVALTVTAAFVLVSAADAWLSFGPDGQLKQRLAPWRTWYGPWRLVNSYHLFGFITRERIEPEMQTSDGTTWETHHFHYKPGDPLRAPPFVAPHQPRVDFRLWFYGLGFRAARPAYVAALLDRLCHDPDAVQRLFRSHLPARPRVARIAYWRYHFTTAAERRESGAWWKRELLATTRPVPCS